MPNEIVVRGTLPEIITKLNRIMEVVRNREATGWPALLSDEVWVYLTMGDDRVCPICRPLERKTFPGDAIPAEFPFHEFISPTVIHPHIHPNCRCHIEWPDSGKTLEERFHREKQLMAD